MQEENPRDLFEERIVLAIEGLAKNMKVVVSKLVSIESSLSYLVREKIRAETHNCQFSSSVTDPILKVRTDCPRCSSPDEQPVSIGSPDCERTGGAKENFVEDVGPEIQKCFRSEDSWNRFWTCADEPFLGSPWRVTNELSNEMVELSVEDGTMQESEEMFVRERQPIVEPKSKSNEDSNGMGEDGVADGPSVPEREPGSEMENLGECVGKPRSKNNQSSVNVKSVSFDIPNGLHDNIKPATATKYSLRKRNEVTVVSSPRCIKSKKVQKEINKGVCDPASGTASEMNKGECSKECKIKGGREKVMGTEGERKSKGLREKTRVQEEGASSTKVKKSYLCQFCSKSFKDTYLLNNHVRVHTGVRPFKCTVCDKTYREKSQLTVHIRTHNDERPFQCSSCVKSFVSSSALKSHEFVHTGEKRFTCGVCAKKFSHKCDLIKHTRVHTGLKPFSCNLCSKSFSRSDHLTVHKRIHSGVRPYVCTICGGDFRQLCGLSYHMRHAHAHA